MVSRAKRRNQKNIWVSNDFVDVIRSIKRARQILDKKDYSDADISCMIIDEPIFKELQTKLSKERKAFENLIRFQLDKRGIKI